MGHKNLELSQKFFKDPKTKTCSERRFNSQFIKYASKGIHVHSLTSTIYEIMMYTRHLWHEISLFIHQSYIKSYIVCKQWSEIRVSYSCKNCIHTPVCIMVNQLLHKKIPADTLSTLYMYMYLQKGRA